MSSFLTPIEQPASLAMREIYARNEEKFGRIMTGVKVFIARMPIAFFDFYTTVSVLDRELELPVDIVLLLRQYVAQLNVCEFCIDTSRYAAILAAMDVAKFDDLADYGCSPLFTDREVAALDYASALTINKHVEQEVFDELARHFSEREICEIVHVVATEHLYNISNLGLNIHSDMFCQVPSVKK
jgi:hypothetical protein